MTFIAIEYLLPILRTYGRDSDYEQEKMMLPIEVCCNGALKYTESMFFIKP